jgi:transglutaminase-like putative cysteine protease
VGQVEERNGAWHVNGRIIIDAPKRGPWTDYPTSDGTPLVTETSDAPVGSLAPEERIEADDPEIRAKAQEILGAVTGFSPNLTRWQAATQVADWVYGNISYVTTFGGAKQTLASRKGDCAPHSFLMTALLRAVGVPCRPVPGLLLTGNIAGQHLWVEVYLGEKIGWVPIDPTSGEIATMGATHIRARDGAWMLAPGFGPIKVKIVRTEMRPL